MSALAWFLLVIGWLASIGFAHWLGFHSGFYRGETEGLRRALAIFERPALEPRAER